MADLLPEEQATIETYDKVAQIWTTLHHTTGFWKEEMKRFNELLPAGSVLDIGAGGGRDAYGLLARGYDYVGTDVSDTLLDIARKEHPKQKFYKQSVYELNFPQNEKFDGFWCSAVLLHIPKKRIDEALNKIKDVIKPRAFGFISLKDGKGEGLERETWSNGEVHKRFFSYWSKGEFAERLQQNGFEIVDYSFRPDSKKTRWHCFFARAE